MAAPKPGSREHDKLLQFVKSRRDFSERHFSQRNAKWRESEKSFRGYVEPTSAAKKDPKVPWLRKLFVPITPLLVQTQLSFDIAAFTQRTPIFPLQGTGPEDMDKAKVMEAYLEWEWEKRRMLLECYGWLLDRRRYGLGVLWNRWVQDIGWRTVRRPRKVNLPLLGVEIELDEEKKREEFLRYEGNEAEVIDPFAFGFDPRVTAARIQDGEFVFKVVRRSHTHLREQQAAGFYENVEFVPSRGQKAGQKGATIGQPSVGSFEREFLGQSDRDKIVGLERGENTVRNDTVDALEKGYADVVEMVARINPRLYGVGESEKPSLWWITMANDAVIIRAEEFDFDHQEFPVAVIESNPDPHSTLNISSVEEMGELQKFANWLYRSHAEHVIRTLNGQYVVDPSKIEIKDILNPGPGNLIRMKPDAMSTPGAIDESIKQLRTFDVTKGHLGEINTILQFLERLSSANENLQGATATGETTLGEQQLAFGSATGRLKAMAQISWTQGWVPWARQRIANAQQLLEQERWIKIVGGVMDALDVPNEDRFIRATPDSIQGEFDIGIIDGIVRGDGQLLQAWSQMFQAIVNSPQLAQRFNVAGIFKFIAHLSGVRNVDEFDLEKQNQPVQGAGDPNDAIQTAPDEDIEEAVRKGDLVPADEALRQ